MIENNRSFFYKHFNMFRCLFFKFDYLLFFLYNKPILKKKERKRLELFHIILEKFILLLKGGDRVFSRQWNSIAISISFSKINENKSYTCRRTLRTYFWRKVGGILDYDFRRTCPRTTEYWT